MGKRELLLVLAFLAAGVVVHQATAPAPRPGEEGFSLGRLVETARREIRGNPAAVEITSTNTHPVTADMAEVQVVGGSLAQLKVTGEDRDDIAATLHVTSHGYDAAEAKKWGEATTLDASRSAGSLVLRLTYPDGRHTGRQRVTLTLLVPSRLKLRVDVSGRATVSGVAAVELASARGDSVVREVSGTAVVTHRGGPISIEAVSALRFEGRGSDLTVRGVEGDAAISMEGGGELHASGLGGGVDVDARHAEVTLIGLQSTSKPVRVTATGGEITLEGLASDARVEGRHTRLDVTMSAAAPAALSTEGGEVLFTPPPGGYRLDVIAPGGQIEPASFAPEHGLEWEAGGEGTDARLSGEVRGGGPLISIRARHGEVRIR